MIYLTIMWLVAIATARKQIWVKFPVLSEEIEAFGRYFQRIDNGYYVDIGGYNPLEHSNTIRLSAKWNGLIVEASQTRASYLKDFHTYVTVLNFAISNVSGDTVTFYQVPYSEGASTISPGAAAVHRYIQQKTTVINMADLCHKYFKAKPNLLNIDVEGVGQSALKSNDWTQQKCVPDIIYAEDFHVNVKAGQPNLQPFLVSQNYTKVIWDKDSSSKLFVHNNKFQFYKKEVQANQQYLRNKDTVNWHDIFAPRIVGTLIGKPFSSNFRPSTQAAYVHLRQLDVISIPQINRYANFISVVDKNRPILILEYDRAKSFIYIGSNNYKLIQRKIEIYSFIEISIQYPQYNLTAYVFDHQKYDKFQLKILQVPTSNPSPSTPSPSPQQSQQLNQQIAQLRNIINQQKIITNSGNSGDIKNSQLNYNQINKILDDYDSKSSLIIVLLLAILLLLIIPKIIKCLKPQAKRSKIRVSTIAQKLQDVTTAKNFQNEVI